MENCTVNNYCDIFIDYLKANASKITLRVSKSAWKMSKDDVALSMPPPYPGYQQDPVPDSKTPPNPTSAHIGIGLVDNFPHNY